MRNKIKINNGDLLYFASVGMWLCCVVFWLSGAKELANKLVVYAVIIGIGGYGISNHYRAKSSQINPNKKNDKS